MSKFDHFFQESLQYRQERGIKRQLKPINYTDSLHINHKNTAYINFSSNDYLGFSFNNHLKQLSQLYIRNYGVGSAASRLITGHTEHQDDLERNLARFLGTEAAIIFASGWQANVAVIACLLENLPKPVWVITDKLNHASLHYGCKAGQTKQIRFHHNDMQHLKERLEFIADEKGTKLIITETIFSMDGDQADLQTLRQLADHYDAFLYLDDAHASGVFGHQGQGLAPRIADLTMGTFSKAWGSFGAYIAGSKALCDWLINYCSGFIHTTALPPSIIGSIHAALELIPNMSDEREYLYRQCHRIKNKLSSWGIETGTSTSQIIPLIIGSANYSVQLAQKLQNKGLWIMPIRPPTVPQNSSRLRLTISAGHTVDEIDFLLETIYQSLHFNPELWQAS
ncbi:aminotransferase class I/II-fold pyridoxal phosphate-dependent enzyme [Commensalibacter oyaizuii]|uniref:8-amino-7-oxononanoate synthase n=1 Tax=Commensalibacter oyaizuii TaxID=3043873 RepID=A0ABT6PZE5_9PROT|nr:8-amino-7-oxononanoate synthase [Commensalibacter sp. TBRC 16381]MDI2090230.1 8-amino-7-oxononanoate synthase [Commensalibacter sp. TBRC 16381]